MQYIFNQDTVYDYCICRCTYKIRLQRCFPSVQNITSQTIEPVLHFGVTHKFRLYPKSRSSGTVPVNLVLMSVSCSSYPLALEQILHCLRYCCFVNPLLDWAMQYPSSPATLSLQFLQWSSRLTTFVQLRPQSIGNLHLQKMFLWCVPINYIPTVIYVQDYGLNTQFLQKN